ncbi:MAG: ATP-binding cassette domain-containing protein [Candidatus Omnitrophica bacterium]|jgi:Fe-S cluster assembly ATP-binding protein|nr:ATP-binding cassette domain-containing protein [Candidatus Omnitrophota bacterium]
MFLDIKDLSVETQDKQILKGIELEIKPGEVAILFGPNGSGKSTLVKAIMGFSGYRVTRGQILINGKDINSLTIEQRVKLGLGIMYQNPPKIRGVKLEQMAGFLSRDKEQISSCAERLSLTSHLKRDINLDFSGGEMKRSELFQLLLQDPQMILLDEPESGVDLENISVMGDALKEFLSREGKSALIITHTGYILDYINAKKGCMMINGKLWCVGDPKKMFSDIRSKGYEKCKICHEIQRVE